MWDYAIGLMFLALIAFVSWAVEVLLIFLGVSHEAAGWVAVVAGFVLVLGGLASASIISDRKRNKP